METYKNQPS